MNILDMNTLGYSHIIGALNRIENTSNSFLPVKIAILRNITCDSIVPYLKYACYSVQLRPEIFMGDYDVIMPEVLSPESGLYRFQPEIIIVCVKLETLNPVICFEYMSFSHQNIQLIQKEIVGYMMNIIAGLRNHTDALILVHNFETLAYPSLGILDYQKQSGQINAVRNINRLLSEQISQMKSVYIIDTDYLQSTIGHSAYFDSRYWHIGKAPYSGNASKTIAKEYAKFIYALKGKNKKCLILDCDNTLWGGIIDEMGFSGIQIGKTYPGSAFREFQLAIRELHDRGVILAVCSKNDEEVVMDVLENHPEMIIRPVHLAAYRVNWQNKAENIRELAEELSIGLESMVFIDDNRFETELVKTMVPEIATIALSGDPTQYALCLKSFGLFDTLDILPEDRSRTAMYRQEGKRKEHRKHFSADSLAEYYTSLEMTAVIERVSEYTTPRISQLTQKTNQFNLTTKRYSENNIAAFTRDKTYDIWSIELSDRFGDMGIVGASIVHYHGKDAEIDTFLLSCRALGRGLEKVLLAHIVEQARGHECRRCIGIYRRTLKNKQTESFYPDNGFIKKKTNPDNEELCFSLDINNAIINVPGYYKSIVFKE